jgi:hypothetical protein
MFLNNTLKKEKNKNKKLKNIYLFKKYIFVIYKTKFFMFIKNTMKKEKKC